MTRAGGDRRPAARFAASRGTAWADQDGEYAETGKETLEPLHEVLAKLMLVALYVGGVVLASIRHHEPTPW